MTHYFTKLHSSVHLQDSYEVALCEINFSKSWFTIPDSTILIRCLGCDRTQEAMIMSRRGPHDNDHSDHDDVEEEFNRNSPKKIFDGDDLLNLLKSGDMDYKSKYSYEYIPQLEKPWSGYAYIPGGYYKTIEDLIDEINTSITKTYSTKMRGSNIAPKLSFDKQTRRVQYEIPDYFEIQFSQGLLDVLGLSSEQKILNNNYHPESNCNKYEVSNDCTQFETVRGVRGLYQSLHASNIHGSVHSLYVYCDLIQHIAVGDASAPLLRIVNANTGNYGDEVHQIYEPPRYMPLLKYEFDTIEIDIRDTFSNPIPFEFGSLNLTLHFRRTKHQY